MVEAVNRISSTAASEPTKVGISTSIGSEPDNAWVAARQSQITADQHASKGAAETNGAGTLVPHADLLVDHEEHPRKQHGHARSGEGEEAGEDAEQPLLSGESERIGTRNFDDDTPFGERVAIL
ncbi:MULTISPECIES: hypothetical protein [Rhizobium]|uniref:hypothetical protein n=1 Tax=Rhizobium TaxID=379 RepID=UPI001B339BFA|nr:MULTISPECIES: hypothetical protein [Rhizobium]MBX4906034.1 hypothetical protein [Rhizobium bangladeshense]MBX5212890.1 hypothetical protein [Rhizobium sp. NLR9a]MBX5220054.1 hypothetical protein [Rhizobium sp. NLR8a]MBX5225537.1 hypothetical protein [Rhizobium sp. NLR9b]MBX5231400.1 hypothetical protein [Rhizobium sp. NLR4a]